MITKEQAVEIGASWGAPDIHYTGRGGCARIIGPRGGVKEAIIHVRPSGACKTWKTRPTDFRLPVKYGMYESFAIDQNNAADFHLASDCQPVERKS